MSKYFKTQLMICPMADICRHHFSTVHRHCLVHLEEDRSCRGKSANCGRAGQIGVEARIHCIEVEVSND